MEIMDAKELLKELKSELKRKKEGQPRTRRKRERPIRVPELDGDTLCKQFKERYDAIRTDRLPEGWNKELTWEEFCEYSEKESKRVGRKILSGFVIIDPPKRQQGKTRRSITASEVSVEEMIKVLGGD
jgi:hypothetical protein